MPRRFIWSAAFVAAASLLLGLQLLAALQLTLEPLDWGGIAAFIIVGLVVNFAAVDFGGGKSGASSMVFLPFLTSAVVFPPAAAALIAFVVVGATEAVQSGRRPAVAIFNTGQAVLAVGLSGLVYWAFAARDTGTIHYLGFIFAAGTFFCTNILLATAGFSLIRQTPWAAVVRQVVGPLGSNLLYDLFASPVAIVIAWLYADQGVAGVLVVLLPLLLVRHFYSSRLKLEQATLDLLEVLVKAIETRDPYTSGHSRRVSELAKQIALDLGVSSRLATVIGRAALLHDIGKIDAVYAEVLRKPHSLTEQERLLIRTHAEKGAELLEGIASVEKQVIAAVKHHHERYDGLGYPAGLKGTAIPLAARIIMLSDSVDAMLSDRPYRKALPLATVRSELEKNAGTQFDPELVSVVLKHGSLERAAGPVRTPNDGNNPERQLEEAAAFA